MTARFRIARDVVIAPNAVNSAEHCVMRPPAVPQEFDDRDADRQADARNHAKHGHADEQTIDSQNSHCWMRKMRRRSCELEQTDGRGDHDRSERAGGQILQQVGCEHQKERDRDCAHDSGQLRLRAGGFGDGCAR